MIRSAVLALLALSALIGLTAVGGRALGHQTLAAWLPGGIAMKEITGAGIIAQAAVSLLLLFARPGLRPWRPVLAAFTATALLSISLFRAILHYEMWGPIDSLFPAAPTVIALIVSATGNTGLCFGRPGIAAACAAAVWVIGTVCVVGYALAVPEMYYYLPPVSTAMALPTGTAFALLGGANLLLARAALSPR